MTSRLALNDDGKLFVRAADLNVVGAFFDLLFTNQQTTSPLARLPGPGDQIFFRTRDQPDQNLQSHH
jgi:hypothetical protein